MYLCSHFSVSQCILYNLLAVVLLCQTISVNSELCVAHVFNMYNTFRMYEMIVYEMIEVIEEQNKVSLISEILYRNGGGEGRVAFFSRGVPTVLNRFNKTQPRHP